MLFFLDVSCFHRFNFSRNLLQIVSGTSAKVLRSFILLLIRELERFLVYLLPSYSGGRGTFDPPPDSQRLI